MSKKITRDNLFKPTRSESKSATTDNAARNILDTETSRREAKTARLKEARLAKEAADREKSLAEPTAKVAKVKKRTKPE
ncbi:hypothetical protein DUT91_04300 [Phyllobacterium salinisoli]|uniref:Uncharacterized protein n=1 Tax=Phyllobacterium salinisoli TaxID=1899321 RepID=A0A368K5P1_9HYPH|nr:hypothetical protein [Phyllobacterium salinisoli]RCS24706.1 hypothetical protein DUT91_04300 [Phyllobacterium salinisoli]